MALNSGAATVPEVPVCDTMKSHPTHRTTRPNAHSRPRAIRSDRRLRAHRSRAAHFLRSARSVVRQRWRTDARQIRDRAMPNMGGCRRTGRSSGWVAVTWQEWVALRPHPWPALAGVRLATAEHSPTLLGLRVTDTERT